MATPTRALLTRVCIPSSAAKAASSHRRRQLPIPGPGTPNQSQNVIAIQRTTIDVERIREQVKRIKIEDEVMRGDLRWATRYYKGMEWSCYAVLSVSAAAVTACEVILRSRKDKGDVRPTT